MSDRERESESESRSIDSGDQGGWRLRVSKRLGGCRCTTATEREHKPWVIEKGQIIWEKKGNGQN